MNRCCANHNPLVQDASHCAIHHVDEGYSPNVFRVCGECGHVYPTRDALERDYLDVWVDIAEMSRSGEVIPIRTPAEKIYYCPHCAHDF